jgi:hypothetical protein
VAKTNLRSALSNNHVLMNADSIKNISSSSSLHGLGESPVPASSIVVSFSIFFLVYLFLVFWLVDIYVPAVE